MGWWRGNHLCKENDPAAYCWGPLTIGRLLAAPCFHFCGAMVSTSSSDAQPILVDPDQIKVRLLLLMSLSTTGLVIGNSHCLKKALCLGVTLGEQGRMSETPSTVREGAAPAMKSRGPVKSGKAAGWAGAVVMPILPVM